MQELEPGDQELIAAFVAGDLEGAPRSDAEALIQRSPEARALADRLGALSALTASVTPVLRPEARARIGDVVERQARVRRRRRRVVGALACVAAAAGLALFVRARPQPAPAPHVETVRTSAGEYRLINVGDRAVAFVGEHAIVDVRPQNPRLRIRAGEVRLVVRSDELEPFVVASPEADVEVLGTEFDVGVREDVTEVRVRRGEVSVRNGLGQRRLWANETARVRRGEGPRYVERLKAIVVDEMPEIREVPAR